MAVWQFQFFIIPKQESSKVHSYERDIENIIENIAWNDYCIKDCTMDELSKVLKPTKAWSDHIKLFGCLESTCVELFSEDNLVDEISIRLDLRDINIDTLKAIINFIRSNDAIILTRDGKLIEPDVSNIIEEIKKSNAYLFLRDPESFLMKMKNE